MKGLILIYIMLAESLEITKIEVGAEYKSDLKCDTIRYHTYYGPPWPHDTFPYLSPYWVFVRFTPGAGDTSPICSLYRVAGWIMHKRERRCAYACTTVVWRIAPLPQNLIARYIFWEDDMQLPSRFLDGGFPAPLFPGQDIWMGRTTVGDPVGGDTVYTITDRTPSLVSDRNFYSTSGQYGTRAQLSTWDNLDLAFHMVVCCRRPAGAEESDYVDSYFKVYPNIFSGNKISFSYKIHKQATIKIYGLDGRLMASKLLPPGKNRIVWDISLPSGIYFYKLHTQEKIFYDKFVIL